MSKEREVVGNFEVGEREVVTRRDVLIMGAMAATGLSTMVASAAQANPAVSLAAPAGGPYVAKDFSSLKLEGISANQLDQHLKLYAGYIKKANETTGKMQDVDFANANATYSPLRELLVEHSYAVNGAVYHEFYFGNMGGKPQDPSGDLKTALEEKWGSYGKFVDYLKSAGKCMRGWVLVGMNTRTGQIDTFGLDMHNMWSPMNFVPLLVLDVYEHAYMIDYGIDRAKYLDAFVKNIDWDVVSKRFSFARKHPFGAESTT